MKRALALLALASCGAPPAPAPPESRRTAHDAPPVESWGTMREALRLGDSRPRVDLADLAANDAVGVGALAGLEGEVTITGGRVLVATVEGTECRVRDARADATATLLVRAEVADWEEHPLPDCASYAELDAAVAEVLAARGFDLEQPTPVRIRGDATSLEYHVIAGACPIATPDGPAPWRFDGPLDDVVLVGFFVEGAAGRFTHHTSSSHLHVVAPGKTGHLDEVSLERAVLLVPSVE